MWSNLIDRFFNYLKTLPTTGRIIVLLAVAGALCFVAVKYFIPPKKVEVDRPGQCDYLIEQNRQLVNALLDIKGNLKSISYHYQQRNFVMFASYADTTPTRKAINRILFKIDSILIKNKIDSLRKVDSLKRVKH